MTPTASTATDYQPFDSLDAWTDTPESSALSEPITCVTFDLMGQIFAVDVGQVREILDMQAISRLPNASGDLLGMIDVRGEGISVVDLASRLGMGGTTDITTGRIIVFELGDSNDPVPVGVIAERVLSVVDLAQADIEMAPRTTVQWQGNAVRGVTRLGGQLVVLLSLDTVFDQVARDPFDFS